MRPAKSRHPLFIKQFSTDILFGVSNIIQENGHKCIYFLGWAIFGSSPVVYASFYAVFFGFIKKSFKISAEYKYKYKYHYLVSLLFKYFQILNYLLTSDVLPFRPSFARMASLRDAQVLTEKFQRHWWQKIRGCKGGRLTRFCQSFNCIAHKVWS